MRLPAGPRPAVEPVRLYFDTEWVTPSQAVTLSSDDVPVAIETCNDVAERLGGASQISRL
jgi:hypothetical protein